MDNNLHHLGCVKPATSGTNKLDRLHINWSGILFCRKMLFGSFSADIRYHFNVADLT